MVGRHLKVLVPLHARNVLRATMDMTAAIAVVAEHFAVERVAEAGTEQLNSGNNDELVAIAAGAAADESDNVESGSVPAAPTNHHGKGRGKGRACE